MVEKWMNERNPEDQWVVITDIFGGSINNEFMIRAQEGGVLVNSRNESPISS